MGTLNLSGQPELYVMNCKNNMLTSIKVANGNNADISLLITLGNTELDCIHLMTLTNRLRIGR